MEEQLHQKNQRENDLALSADVRSLAQKKQKWLFAKHKLKS